MRYSHFLGIVAVAVLCAAAPAARADLPEWLPRYDLQFDLDVAKRELTGHMQATWSNHYQRPVRELVFNAHSHYVVPDADIGFDAKMLELLRVDAGEVLGVTKPPCDVDKITLTGDKPLELPFHYEGDTNTTLVVPLPFELEPGHAVTIDLAFRFHIPAKQGRWGQWAKVTTLSNWLPVFAVFDDTIADDTVTCPPGQASPTSKCWQPTPFIPWHQPFFNEAGIYHVRATLPGNQKSRLHGRDCVHD